MPALIPIRGVDKWPNQALYELQKAERTRLEAMQKADGLYPEISGSEVNPDETGSTPWTPHNYKAFMVRDR